MTRSDIRVAPFSSALGALVTGIDLREPLSDEQFAVLQKAFRDHEVLFFRDQQLTPEQHLAFARRWAPIDVNRFFKAVPGYPEIAEVRKEADQRTNIGGGWHTDHSYDPEPAMGSLLLAREVPPLGGDTLFASMSRALEALSPSLQQTLEGLRAVHSARHVFGEKGGYASRADAGDRIGNAAGVREDVVHPVVIRHPLSGRRILYVNPGFTVRFDGWTQAESEPLLQFLYQHAAQPEFSCRFDWTSGAMAFWDNRATWHFALNDYHGHRRVMHRITVQGGPVSSAVQ